MLGELPLLPLANGEVVQWQERRKRGGGPQLPKKPRQVQRLAPSFLALQKVLDAQKAQLTESPIGAEPEHVLVFETVGHPEKFFAVVRSHPGLEWLLDTESRFPEDADFKKKGRNQDPEAARAEKELSSCVYMVMFNQAALEQLLSMWKIFTEGKMPKGMGAWSEVFRTLRSIRRWGPDDRLRDAGLIEDALQPIDLNRRISIEIELWPRSGSVKDETRVRAAVEAAGGEVLDALSLPDIRYHALLIELPHRQIQALLDRRDVHLLLLDEIYLIRPRPQIVVGMSDEAPVEISANEFAAQAGLPVIALLDGLPMENHPLLRGRLIVDDPDDWSSTYPVKDRAHGTAMASLILRGDRANNGTPSRRAIYARPILQAHEGEEQGPRRHLWLDVIHRAIRRMLADDEPNGPVARTVKIVNLSVGDRGRPFLHEPSPLARLLDWLSWKYQVLFIVSAGNHDAPLPHGCSDDAECIRHVYENSRHRRLLSPAEAINCITVGALASDAGTDPLPPRAQLIPSRPDLPAPYSAIGRGFRRSVKPDVFFAGGRALFRQQPPIAGANWRSVNATQVGHWVASPAPAGQRQMVRRSGSSCAAALTSRAADEIVDSVERTVALAAPDAELHTVPIALLVKALIVHSSSWEPECYGTVSQALNDVLHPTLARDQLAGILGYGAFKPERALGCEPTRATLVGGGIIGPRERVRHVVPIPEAMHLQRGSRRVTMTLAWFSPINPADRRYRVASLALALPKDSPLLIESSQVHRSATLRGTVQHLVLDGDGGLMSIANNEQYEFFVTCSADAGELSETIPYALAVSIEMAPETALPIYSQVQERIATRVAIRA